MNPTNSPTDPIIALLDQERMNTLAQVERVPLARRTERPASDRWSVADVMEHVARVDFSVSKLLAMREGQPLTATPDEVAAAQLTPAKIAGLRSRARPVEAPERVRPTGTQSLEEVLHNLTTSRESLKNAYLAATPAVLDGAIHPHPFFGPLTLRAWVELSAHHEARHAQQIAEIAE